MGSLVVGSWATSEYLGCYTGRSEDWRSRRWRGLPGELGGEPRRRLRREPGDEIGDSGKAAAMLNYREACIKKQTWVSCYAGR